jgi:hypothetical protein
MNEIDVVCDVSRRFEQASIPYMLTGSMAMNYYAQPHDSRYRLRHRDCIIRKKIEYQRVEFDRRQRISIRDFSTFIATKEDLIISKLFWAKDFHSELQLNDVRNLLATGYDAVYLRHWTHALGLDNLLQGCLE